MPPAFTAIFRRARLSSLSIGQLTFSGFLLVLAIIMVTSIASGIAVRHLDTTFAELQRLQTVGDLAEEIDRRMNGLRLAGRDSVTDPDTQPDRGPEPAVSLGDPRKKPGIQLRPSQAKRIE